MVEGTPLERVQVVNSGARVQIPPSPLAFVPEEDSGRRQHSYEGSQHFALAEDGISRRERHRTLTNKQ